MSAPHPRFCLDESSLRELDPNSQDLPSLIEEFALCIQACHGDRQTVVKPPSFFEGEIWEAVWEEGRLERDQLNLFLQVLQSSPDLSEETMAGLSEADVETGSTTRASLAAAYSFSCLHEKKAVCCLCVRIDHQPCGRLHVRFQDVETKPLHFISDPSNKLAFYRDIPEVEDISGATYVKLGELAFPHLYLHPELGSHFNRLKVSYRQARALVTHHLSFLNDHFQEIFERLNGDPSSVSREARARGVDLSGDSTNERANPQRMRKRTVSTDEGPVYCSWHTKLFPQHDRIYFRPAASDIAKGRILIGILHRHL